MSNLTQHLRVVGTEQAGMHPQPGWYLVVLKQVGEGRVFHSLLQPGQLPPEPKLFERMRKQNTNLVGIPVTASANLRHEFTSTIPHVSPGHAFEADYFLSFSVAAPDIVATKWIEDPIRRIEEEIRRLLDGAARTVAWNDLRNHILRDGAADLCLRAVRDRVDEVTRFAGDFGLHIYSLRCGLRLSIADAQTDVARAELDRKKANITMEAERRLVEMDVDHKLEILGAEHKAELRDLQRPEQLRDAGVESAIEALKTVAAHPPRWEELSRTVRDLSQVFSQRPVIAAGTRTLGSADRLALPAATESAQKLRDSVESVATLVDGLPGDPVQKRELLAAFLHLIAEASRGAGTDPGVRERYESLAADLIGSWAGLKPEQFTSLRRFAYLDNVREALA